MAGAASALVRTEARAAALTLSATSASASAVPVALVGLPTQSTAPSSRARRVISAPAWVRLETMTTGIGRRRMIFSRNSMPFMFGISMSRVTTSGFRALIMPRASNGSPAAPTTSISGSRVRAAVIRLRMVAESSTTRTQILAISDPPCGRRSGRRFRRR